MDVIFLEHEQFYKNFQNPIQGETTNTKQEELNFDVLAFEGNTDKTQSNTSARASKLESNPCLEIRSDKVQRTNSNSGGDMRQLTEIEMNQADAPNIEPEEEEIIQSDNPLHNSLTLLKHGTRLVLLSPHLNYHQEKIGEIHQSDMCQRMVPVQRNIQLRNTPPPVI